MHIWGEIQNSLMSYLTSGTLNSTSSRKDYFKRSCHDISCQLHQQKLLLVLQRTEKCYFNLLCSKQRIGAEFSCAYKIHFRTKSFLLKSGNNFGRKSTCGILLCDWQWHHWKIISCQKMNIRFLKSFWVVWVFWGFFYLLIFVWSI